MFMEYFNITVALWQVQHFSGEYLFYLQDSMSNYEIYQNFSLEKLYLNVSTFPRIIRLVWEAAKVTWCSFSLTILSLFFG
jgi:hypothetical protein